MIKINNVYYMLAYSYKALNAKDKQDYQKENFDNIYDLFAVMIEKCVNKQIKKGLIKDYVTYEENIKGIRGKININASIKKSTKRTNSLICEYDEYSINTYFNQIVKTAILYLIRSNNIKDKKKLANLKRIIRYFINIEEIKEIKKIKWKSLRFTNKTISYRFLMEICKLILSNLYIGKKNGELQFNDFLEDKAMASLFESFIREYYILNMKDLNVKSTHIDWNCNKDNAIGLISDLPEMRTDVTISNNDNDKILVIDAKFYINALSVYYDKKSFKSVNLYQLYSYVKNEDVYKSGNVSGLLLFAKTEDDELGWTCIEIDGNTFAVTDLDLNSDFSVIEDKLNDIIRWYKDEITLKELDIKYNSKINK